MSENYIEIANIVLANLTNNYSKSYSVCRLYTVASQIVMEKISEISLFDMDEMIKWLKSKSDEWYKGKYKAVKRFVYMMNDYLMNGEFTTLEFVYFDTSFHSQLLNEHEIRLIKDYCFYKNYSADNHFRIRAEITPLFLYLKSVDKTVFELDYKLLFDFYEHEKSNHKSEANFHRIICEISSFLSYLADFKIIENYRIHYVFKYNAIEYLKILVNNKEIIYKELLEYTSDFSYDLHRNEMIDEFISIYESYNYAKKHVVLIKRIVNFYYIFANYFNIGISHELIDYWASQVVRKNTSGYKEYRKIMHAYLDFSFTKKFDIDHIYSKPTNYDLMMPEWAKHYCDMYIDYRIKLGYKYNTIMMDKNSIMHLVLYLDKSNLYSFEEVTTQQLIDFQNNDIHSTLEGKNAYMSRIRGFLLFLKDKGIINIAFNSAVFEGYRFSHKVVDIIEKDELDIIYSHIENFKSRKQVRNICIFLLGVRMGMRGIDIVNLQFSNISFKTMTIKYMQQKTNIEIVLPMPTIVANSIYHYVKYSRPSNSNNYLFITDRAPYRKYKRNICTKAFIEVYETCGLNYHYNGFHITRKTYASTILRNTHDISITASSLGHTSNDTVDDYILLDKEKMKRCGLSLNHIPYGGMLL